MPAPHPSRPRMLPRTVGGVTPGQRIEEWADLVDSCEEVLLAGLRRKVGPSGDVKAAYREWQARQMAEHERGIRGMLERLNQAEARHAG
jgi:hypothetical protein